MKTLNDLLPILQDAKRDLMAKYPITEMGVFGSYARGDADEGSDLDILYVMNLDGISLFDLKNRLKLFLAPCPLGGLSRIHPQSHQKIVDF